VKLEHHRHDRRRSKVYTGWCTCPTERSVEVYLAHTIERAENQAWCLSVVVDEGLQMRLSRTCSYLAPYRLGILTERSLPSALRHSLQRLLGGLTLGSQQVGLLIQKRGLARSYLKQSLRLSCLRVRTQ
jgi:hypothetical protein